MSAVEDASGAVAAAGARRRPFPLIPRRRQTGLPFGELASRRRGRGSEVIGHRPYEHGDPVASIDWPASARLSATSGADAFVVRDHAADEAPRVALVVDHSPAMGLYPEPLPWLSKRTALREAAAAIVASASVARADIAALDFADGRAWWLPPGRRDRRWLIAQRQSAVGFDGPQDSVARALTFLERRRRQLPSGSFVFVLSDLLTPPPPAHWRRAVSYGWDMVAVVIQDPVWERSFPAVGGVAVPVSDPRSGAVALIRVSRRQAGRLRDTNERRHAGLRAQLAALGVDVVAIASSDARDIDSAFIQWSQERSRGQRAR